MFLISQVGDDSFATTFLKSIEQDQMIRDMVYCSPERLDDMIKTLGSRLDSQAYTAKVSFTIQGRLVFAFRLTFVVLNYS